MSHTIYVTRIILRPLSALFGLQFLLPIEKSVTFTGACANEIIRRNNSVFFLTKGKSEVMLELYIITVLQYVQGIKNECYISE